MCIDQGDPLRTVAPQWLFSHIQSAHGRKISIGFSEPPIRATAPQPVQPSPIPFADVWEFVERGGEQWVVCPFCPSDKNTVVKPKNIVRHLAKVHMVSYRDRLCLGCKVAVPPEQLVNHTACKHWNQPIATDETPLKRKEDSRCDQLLGSSLKSAKSGQAV